MSAKYKVLSTDHVWPSVEPERQELAKVGAELILGNTFDEAKLIALVPPVDGILVNWAGASTNLIRAAENCKVISRFGVGVDNIDIETATELGIIVANVAEYCVDEVSNHAFALLLACARKIKWLDRNTDSGSWSREVGPPMRRVWGQTLGIIGLGRIGGAVARKARAFGLEVLAYDPYLSGQSFQDCGARSVDLPELLAQSDFVTIHSPMTPETAKLLGEQEFRQMKSTAYVINTARGGIIDAVALDKALTAGQIAGAGLDVLPTEPPNSDDPLLKRSDVILTPHAAFLSEESVVDMEVSAARSIAQVLAGQLPDSVVNPEVLESTALRASELGY